MKQSILLFILLALTIKVQAQKQKDNYKKNHLRLTVLSLGLEYEHHFKKEQSLLIAAGYTPRFVNEKLYIDAFYSEVEFRKYNKKQVNRESLFTFFHGARFLYTPDLSYGPSDDVKYTSLSIGYNPGYLFKYKFIHLLFSFYIPLSYDIPNNKFRFLPLPQFNLGFNLY